MILVIGLGFGQTANTNLLPSDVLPSVLGNDVVTFSFARWILFVLLSIAGFIASLFQDH